MRAPAQKKRGGLLLVLAAAMAVLALAGCQSARSAAYGRENVGYVQFVSSTKHGSVKVVLDGSTEFSAKVNSSAKRTIENGSTYAVQPGSHELEVYGSGGKLLLSRTVFISAQEIRTVSLP
ncbi:MAG TPA: hypothetical protein DDW78_00465 [Treponema sp.]|nr:hypothetical protein [Treponema sp.]